VEPITATAAATTITAAYISSKRSSGATAIRRERALCRYLGPLEHRARC
jgi:hypothetical protein